MSGPPTSPFGQGLRPKRGLCFQLYVKIEGVMNVPNIDSNNNFAHLPNHSKLGRRTYQMVQYVMRRLIVTKPQKICET